MDYYKNKNGKDLRSFLIESAPVEWSTFCLINAMKYQIRAGKKQGETSEKDFKKRDNYLEDYIKIMDCDAEEIYKELDEAVGLFNNYDN